MFTTNVFIASLTLCTFLVAIGIGCDRMENQAIIDRINAVSADDIGKISRLGFEGIHHAGLFSLFAVLKLRLEE